MEGNTGNTARCSFANDYGVHCVRSATHGDRCGAHARESGRPTDANIAAAFARLAPAARRAAERVRNQKKPGSADVE